jgi:hypothetical protein
VHEEKKDETGDFNKGVFRIGVFLEFQKYIQKIL